MLTAKEIVESREKTSMELPSFGAKDFEPDGSIEQSSDIQNSIFEIKKIISNKRVKLLNTLSHAVWHPELHLAEITHKTGSVWAFIGHQINQKLFVYPEEALYLLETGSLQITYNDVPLSVERAYFLLLDSKHNITLEKYKVYSLLNNYGFTVVRHCPQNSVTKYEKKLDIHKLGLKLKENDPFLKRSKRLGDSTVHSSGINKKPKVENVFPTYCSEESNSSDILNRIQKIQPYHDNTDTELIFEYDLYNESEKHLFKKSCLRLPNFRVIIHRGNDPFPDLKNLCKLVNKYEDEVPIIHAIVFFDCISFYQIKSVICPDAHSWFSL